MTTWIMTILEEDNELSIFLNSDNRIFIEIGEGKDDMTSKYICINKEDATNLRNELDELIKSME